jgi:hypothetical protein
MLLDDDLRGQAAALRRVPKKKHDGRFDLDWKHVAEADKALAEKLIKRLKGPCIDALKTVVFERGGATPYAHRVGAVKYIESNEPAASSEDESSDVAADYRKTIVVTEKVEYDPREEPEEQDIRREREIRERAIIGFELFSKIQLIIHDAVSKYDESKGTTLETWVRICAQTDALDHLNTESGIAGASDGRKRDKTEAVPIDVYERAHVAHRFRAAAADVGASLRRGHAHKRRGKIALNADGESTYLEVLSLFWRGLQSNYVLDAIGRPLSKAENGRRNGPGEIARQLGVRPNAVTKHIARARREIPSLAIADLIETARLNYSKNLRNKKSAAHFYALIRNHSEGALPPSVEAGVNQREKPLKAIGVDSHKSEPWERQTKVKHLDGKVRSLPACKSDGEPRTGREGITFAELNRVKPSGAGGHRHRSARRLGTHKVWSEQNFPGYGQVIGRSTKLKAEDIKYHAPTCPTGRIGNWYASRERIHQPTCPYTGKPILSETVVVDEISKSDASADMRLHFLRRLARASQSPLLARTSQSPFLLGADCWFGLHVPATVMHHGLASIISRG